MSKSITLDDQAFQPYISKQRIALKCSGLADRIREDYDGKRPLLLGVMNGACMFAADLARELSPMDCELAFCRTSSYTGTQRAEDVVVDTRDARMSGPGRHILVIEDILDTGSSMKQLLRSLEGMAPASLSVCAMLYKKHCSVNARYIGFTIPNEAFVVGYGMDYNGIGRNLRSIYYKL